LSRDAVFHVTRSYRFSASHRLHAPQLSETENQELYGKCNNPHGHGHNYVLDVTARGPVDESGRAVDLERLDGLVQEQVLAEFGHRNLNLDGTAFEGKVPTTENLAVEICRRLKAGWGAAFAGEWPQLEGVRIEETARNIFVVKAHEIE
jgi:6-pyruvoyltetrahydropterin/6-carboxytetrahydropterin synthase